MKVKISLHDGKSYIEIIENFDLVSFIDEINNQRNGLMIQFGKIGIVKGLIKEVDTDQERIELEAKAI